MRSGLLRPLGAWLLASLSALAPASANALELNDANRAQIEQLDGVGVMLAARILDERAARGPFADWADLERRVKGLRARKLAALAAQGLTVGGKERPSATQEAVPRPSANAATPPPEHRP